ncbi:MAG: alkaline phosphatase family protein [Alphaproteobacteria bacterium]|nr:alkaline phosphatase family protein [Alphaproteobacteria bacterium]
MKRIVLVVCDGHRDDLVQASLCPAICGLGRESIRFGHHRSVYPSTTRVASASIATGCRPARHGLHGNTMGLVSADGVQVHDVGPPGFRAAMRAATGATLRAQTMAERLAAHGGSIVFSNVSPGGAYFQDPDGHGHVYHRAGSYGPGEIAIAGDDALSVSHDGAGDRAMTERFCREVLVERRPALAVLWLCEPDHAMHANILGSPAHHAAIAAADACVARVAETVRALERRGDEILLLVGSDHGQESIETAVPVTERLVAAGLKESLDSPEVAVAPQGSAGLVYLAPRAADRIAAIVDCLRAQDEIAEIHAGAALAEIGMAASGCLAIAFSMAKRDAPNGFGVPGHTHVVADSAKTPRAGIGQHGGLGRYEQSPFLMLRPPGGAAGRVETRATSIIDIAPTALGFLGLPAAGMDGRALPLR